MYAVTQKISFCYGHRLLNHRGRCAHLHGHNAAVEMTLESATLDSQGMVMDFGAIEEQLTAWISKMFDHKMLLVKWDPLVAVLEEAGEPIVKTDANPTAEYIAKWIFDHARSQEFPVTQVRVWETPEQSATYRS